MAKEDFVQKIKDGQYLIEGKWYNKCHYDHLIEDVISGEHLLMEYYRRESVESDSDLLCKCQVWTYGADRGEFTPHLHIIKGKKGSEFNIEIHLLDFEVFHMKKPIVQDITWNDVDVELKKGFFEWLTLPCAKNAHFSTNAEYVFFSWDEDNPTNTLRQFVESRKLQNNIHPLLKEYLYGKPINISDLVAWIFTSVSKLYNSLSEQELEKIHKIIIDPLEWSKVVESPFEFTEYNMTQEIKSIITQHEKTVYQMAKAILNGK